MQSRGRLLLLACNLRRLRLSWILLLIRLSNWGDLTSRNRLFLCILWRYLLSWWLLLCTWLRLSSLSRLLIYNCFIMSRFICSSFFLIRFVFSQLLFLFSLNFKSLCISDCFIMSRLLSSSLFLCCLLCSNFSRFCISDSFLFGLFSLSYFLLSSLLRIFLRLFCCLLSLDHSPLSIQLSLELSCLFSCLCSLSEFNLSLIISSFLLLFLDVVPLLLPVPFKAKIILLELSVRVYLDIILGFRFSLLYWLLPCVHVVGVW